MWRVDLDMGQDSVQVWEVDLEMEQDGVLVWCDWIGLHRHWVQK